MQRNEMGVRVLRWGLFFLIAAIIPFRLKLSSRTGKEERSKKVWSGRSFEAETQVESFPKASFVAPGFQSERVWSGQDDWEPAIAVDPHSNYVYQLTTRFTGPKPCGSCSLPAIVFRSSSNGGVTWSRDRFVLITGKRQADPEIEVAGNGKVYAAFLDGLTVKLAISSNHGVTWSPSATFAGAGKNPHYADKPILAISSNGQHIYIGFNSGDGYVVASHNGGRTFSAPVRTSRTGRTWFHTGGAVAADGTVYFSTTDFASGYEGDSKIRILKSTNGGRTWSTNLVDTSREQPGCPSVPGCYLGFLGPSAAMAVDISGRIMILYHANNVPGAPQSMYYRTSFDAIHWSPRRRISFPNSRLDSAFPALAAGPAEGDFRAAWQTDRDPSMHAWNTWFRQTKDGGLTWSAPKRLSDRATGAPYKRVAGFRFPYGDYFEIGVDSLGKNYLIWGEGDSYRGPGGSWYTSGF